LTPGSGDRQRHSTTDFTQPGADPFLLAQSFERHMSGARWFDHVNEIEHSQLAAARWTAASTMRKRVAAPRAVKERGSDS